MSESPLAGGGERDHEPDAAGGALIAHVESYDAAPDECTIYLTGLDDEDLVTCWVSARAGSFVDLRAMR